MVKIVLASFVSVAMASTKCGVHSSGGCLGKMPERGESTNSSLPLLDLKTFTHEHDDTEGLTPDPRMNKQFRLLSDGADEFPGTARYFENSNALLKFFDEKVANGSYVPVDQSDIELNTEMYILDRKPVDWGSVLMTCHTKPGEMIPKAVAVCHRPMRSQRFFQAHVRVPSGEDRQVLFTEHVMFPSSHAPSDDSLIWWWGGKVGDKICEEDCVYMHHSIERVVMSTTPPMVV